MNRTFSQLPTELVELICEPCELETICALRLTCAKLNRKTLRRFTTKYFSTVRIDLSAKSLQKLQEISEEEQFNTQVSTLLIDWAPSGYYGEGLRWSRHGNGYLEETQISAEPLKDILCHRMTNCRSFYIRGGQDNAEAPENLSATDVASLVLSIVAQTSLRIVSFGVGHYREDFKNRVHASGSLYGKRLHPSTFFQYPGFIDAWAHLAELHLYQDINPGSISWTIDLMRLAINLRSLTLAVDSSHSKLGRELLTAAAMHRIGGLQPIYLRCVYATDLHLFNFLDHSRGTLQTLSLRCVSVVRDRGVSVLFHHLRKEFPELRSLSVLCLFGGPSLDDTSTKTWIIFPNLSEKLKPMISAGDQLELTTRRRGICGIDYTGGNMTKVLKCLEESAEPLERTSSAPP